MMVMSEHSAQLLKIREKNLSTVPNWLVARDKKEVVKKCTWKNEEKMERRRKVRKGNYAFLMRVKSI